MSYKHDSNFFFKSRITDDTTLISQEVDYTTPKITYYLKYINGMWFSSYKTTKGT